MKTSKEQFQSAQQGTGSAENRGEDRSQQTNQNTDLSKQERTDIAAQMGKGPNPVTSIKEMGGMSGRDDAAGGSGDRMEEQSTGERTEK